MFQAPGPVAGTQSESRLSSLTFLHTEQVTSWTVAFADWLCSCDPVNLYFAILTFALFSIGLSIMPVLL